MYQVANVERCTTTESNDMTNRISHIDYYATCSPVTSSKSVSVMNPVRINYTMYNIN
jgi:hypothetical protein